MTPLLGGQHGRFVLQFAGGRDDVVGRHGDLDFVIAELQREFAVTNEGFVLPAGIVGIGDKPREPLRQKKDIRVTVAKMLVTTASTDAVFMHDVERPIDGKTDTLPGCQRLTEIDTHHRANDSMCQWTAA